MRYAIGVWLLRHRMPTFAAWVSLEACKHNLLAYALQDDDGLRRIARAMINPLRGAGRCVGLVHHDD